MSTSEEEVEYEEEEMQQVENESDEEEEGEEEEEEEEEEGGEEADESVQGKEQAGEAEEEEEEEYEEEEETGESEGAVASEEPEEEEGESDSEGRPSKRARMEIMRNDELLAENARVRGTNEQLQSRVDRLEKENAELRGDLGRAEDTIASLRDAVSALSAAGSGPSRKLSSRPNRKVYLRFNAPSANGVALENIPVPYRFTGVRSFPHGIATNNRKHIPREYQVEQRRPLVLSFSLFFMDTGAPATERDICHSGIVPFQMKILYSDDGTEVKSNHFTRVTVDSLTNPRGVTNGTQNMHSGQLSFDFKLCFASTDTDPRNRQFVVQVSPAPGTGFEEDPLLCAQTVAFTVRAKTTAPKA